LYLVQDAGHHAADDELLPVIVLDVRILRILGCQPDGLPRFSEPLHGKLPVDHGHDHMAVTGLDRAVHDDLVPVKDASADHRPSGDPEDEGGVPMQNQVLVEIDTVFHVVFRGAGKPGGYAVGHDGDPSSRRIESSIPAGREIVENFSDLAQGHPDRLGGLAVGSRTGFPARPRPIAAPPRFDRIIHFLIIAQYS
jgi:hypothetical protein